jgi:DNA-binding LytR/AlgR family response regulator
MLQVVIIDDEPKAIELLKNYIERLPFLNCLESFRNPLDGLGFIQYNQVDLLLLDINMPKLSGISLAKTIKPSTKIIFTTAYSEYAVESYELNAIDYLLKPISFERFLKAIVKIKNVENKEPLSRVENKSISLKSGHILHRVSPRNILYLEKQGNYMFYNLNEGKRIMVRESISDALTKLPNYFIQIHRSFIISLNSIESIESNHLLIKGEKLPIGKKYKEKLISFLNIK